MFSSTYYFNEGHNQSDPEAKKREFFEGKNPKTTSLDSVINNWQSAKKTSHVNAKWEKLRK